ncbi:MAG TPA: P-loop NTPase [Pirellulales bacterium]|jgi:flagellar biosynthesis protein FlhG|nr:P-loop NTPase [Pirellulales bacterium]
MPDQANDLRNLVLRSARSSPAPAAPPKLVVVAGGKGGVGTTTIAVNLAIALARDGRRVVLVDADLDGADAGTLCRLDEPSSTVADVLSGRLSVHEALERGPAGIQVLPGAWGGSDGLVDCSPSAQQRLLVQLKCLGAYADFVILDVGSGANRVIGNFWQTADQVFLVTTPDVVSVMDAYAAVKVLCAGVAPPSLKSVVNFAPAAAAAADVHQRLSRACRRFLGLKLTAGGHIPCDPRVAQGAAERQPFMLEHPTCEAAVAVEQLAQWLCQPAAKPAASSKSASRAASAARRASA